MWVAPSAGRGDTAVARIARCDVSLLIPKSMRLHPVPDRSVAAASALSATVDRRGISTRHAGYFDGEWERP